MQHKMNNMKDKNHLPFVERFRPRKLDEVISHNDTILTLKKFLKNHNIPHLLFYGPPGTGKTSTIEAFVTELYGEDNVEFMTMNINASEERGIEIVRNKIKNFVSTLPIKNSKPNAPNYKFVILDEADAMTFDAQNMLKHVSEANTSNARFCLICNCNKKINPAIQSRCAVFNFPPLDFESVTKKINQICKKLNITITSDGVDTIWKLSDGDMRKVMHMMQVLSINNKEINSDTVTDLQKYPTRSDMTIIYETLMKGNLHKSLEVIDKIMKQKYYSLIDVMTEIIYLVNQNIISGNLNMKKGAKIILGIRDIEMNIIVTSDTTIQLYSLISLFTE